MIVGFLVDHLLDGQKQTDISLLRVVIVLYNNSEPLKMSRLVPLSFVANLSVTLLIIFIYRGLGHVCRHPLVSS